MSEEKVIGTKRNLKAPVDLEIVGPKRAKARQERKRRAVEMQIAAPRPKAADGESELARPHRRPAGPPRWRPLHGLVAAALVMIALTVGVYLELPRYQPVGEPLLAGSLFAAGLDGWQQAGRITMDPAEPGRVTIENHDPGGRAYLRRTVDLPPGQKLLALSTRVATDGVLGGDRSWQRARVYLVRLDADGEPDWAPPHHLVRLISTKSARTVHNVFAMPDQVRRARLGLELTNATGRMTVEAIGLGLVEEQPGFRAAAAVLMVAWGGLAVVAVVALLRCLPSTSVRLWIGAMLCLLVVGLFIPADLRDQVFDRLMALMGVELADPDTIGHALMFTVLAFIVRTGRPQDRIGLHLGLWLLIGVVTEILQLFTPDRETSLVDFSMDAAGIVLGLTLAPVLPRILAGMGFWQRSERSAG